MNQRLPCPLPRVRSRQFPALRLGHLCVCFLASVLAGLMLAGTAQAEPDPAPTFDPPARVGRVSLLRGRVDTASAPGAAWEPSRLNQPVTTQTAFWAPPGSQAELRIGSTAVRLDGNTQAVFSQLDDHGVAIDVAQGGVRARLRSLPTGDTFSLSADGVRAEAQLPGDYRVAYDPDRHALMVRALSGRLRVVTPTNSFNLEAGQESLVENGGRTVQLRAMGERDAFDHWAEARDREQDRIAASRYVSPEVTGIESLDEHGVWEARGDYGPVWYPSGLPLGWAPYRYGRWAWVSPWGWTWIDDSPWGFAPFHYGRWAQIGHRWAWVPGPIGPRPVWAPALVGYTGGSPGKLGWNVGIGAPVGWFPLAPFETYRPPYRHSVTYVNQINIIHGSREPDRSPGPDDRPRTDRRPWGRHEGSDTTAPPDRAYRYAHQPDALTVVPENRFRQARPVAREHLPVTPRQASDLQPLDVAAPPGRPEPQRGILSAPPTPAAPAMAPMEPERLPLPRREPGRRDAQPPMPALAPSLSPPVPPAALPAAPRWAEPPPRGAAPLPQERGDLLRRPPDVEPDRRAGVAAPIPTPAPPPNPPAPAGWPMTERRGAAPGTIPGVHLPPAVSPPERVERRSDIQTESRAAGRGNPRTESANTAREDDALETLGNGRGKGRGERRPER